MEVCLISAMYVLETLATILIKGFYPLTRQATAHPTMGPPSLSRHLHSLKGRHDRFFNSTDFIGIFTGDSCCYDVAPGDGSIAGALKSDGMVPPWGLSVESSDVLYSVQRDTHGNLKGGKDRKGNRPRRIC